MFKIGIFSKLVHVSPRMLRHYEKCGLFIPAKIDKLQGYRYYSSSQIPYVKKIVTLRDMGFTIEEILDIVENFEDENFISNAIELKRKQVTQRLYEEQEKLSKLDEMSKLTDTGEYLNQHTVTIKEFPSEKILSLREQIFDYSHQENQWIKLYQHIEQHKLQNNLNGKIYCIYHNMGYMDKNPDLEVGVIVNELDKDIHNFKYRQTEEIPMAASALFEGHYSNMAEWEGILACWIEQNGYEIIGYEHIIGYKHPFNESDPNNYLTEMFFPIKKIKGE